MPPSESRHRPPASVSFPLAVSVLAVIAAGAIVYHRTLGYDFSQDDFLGLGRAAGMVPRLHGPWRWLGNQAIFDLLRPVAGLVAQPYHLASLLAHVACGVLMLMFLRRRFTAPAATLAAIFFVSHPSSYTGVYWVSVIADPLALAFALGALLALDTEGLARWLAVPLFALSLLSKESTILLPLVAVFASRPGAPSEARRVPPWQDPVLLTMAGTSIGYVAYFALSAYGRYFVAPGTGAESSAYAIGLGGNLFANLLSYIGWTTNFWLPTVQGFSDAVDPRVTPWAIGTIALWLIGCAIPGLRRRGWLVGGIVYALLLIPVLPLKNHTYHYYLYAPLLGAAWCLAALFDFAFDRAPAPKPAPSKKGSARASAPAPSPRPMRAAWIGGSALAALLTVNGYALVERIETYPFSIPGLRSDPTVDRAIIVNQVRRSLALAVLPVGTRLAFFSPIAAADLPTTATSPADTESYLEKNVKSALVGGLAVRLLFPVVQDVVFLHTFRPLPHPWLYAVYRPDGQLKLATSTELDSVLRVYNNGPR